MASTLRCDRRVLLYSLIASSNLSYSGKCCPLRTLSPANPIFMLCSVHHECQVCSANTAKQNNSNISIQPDVATLTSPSSSLLSQPAGGDATVVLERVSTSPPLALPPSPLAPSGTYAGSTPLLTGADAPRAPAAIATTLSSCLPLHTQLHCH